MKPNSYNLLSLLALVATSTLADEPTNESYLCSHPQMTEKRVVELNYLEPGLAVPCEVSYIKEENRQVLWRANSEQGFCEAKLKNFLAKQAGWGWECEQMQ